MCPHLLPGHNECWQGGKKKQIASPDWPKVQGKSPSKLPVWDIKKCVESSSNLQRRFWMLHLKSWHQDLQWDMFVTFLLVEKFLTEEHILTAEFDWSKMGGLEICSHDSSPKMYTPENGKSPFKIWDTYSNGCVSIVMFVFRAGYSPLIRPYISWGVTLGVVPLNSYDVLSLMCM